MTTPNISYPEPASALSAESRTREAILNVRFERNIENDV